MAHTIEKTSKTILEGLKLGDDARWGEFVGLYEPLLYRYVRKLGLNEHDAADVVQEIWIALHRKMKTFELDHSKGRFRTWLFRVTQNAVVDWARARKKDRQLENELFKTVQEGTEEASPEWDKELQARVMEVAIQQVKSESVPKSWTCFEEHLLKGRSGAEVGAEVGLPPNTVYVNALRTLKKVKELCARLMEEKSDE